MPQFFARAGTQVLAQLKKESHAEEWIERVKALLAPVMLRRLKSDVLSTVLPVKKTKVVYCEMTSVQRQLYTATLEQTRIVLSAKGSELSKIQNLLMELRKIANHPCLTRCLFDESTMQAMAQMLKQRDLDYSTSPLAHILEDLAINSDFELQNTVLCAGFMTQFRLSSEQIFQAAGKLTVLQRLLAKCLAAQKRVLLFSQMTRVLDILEPFLDSLGYAFLRLDGSTAVEERQALIDSFRDSDVPIFLLSTKAGGLGINLTSANVAIFYDISFNPQVDLQAEDRCHRLGQTKDVKIYKLVTRGTVEESVLQSANRKQQLRDAVLEEGTFAEEPSGLVAKLLLNSALDLCPET